MNRIILISVFSILTLHVMAQEKIVQTAGRDQLGEFAPKFAELNDDVLFGNAVWNDSTLSLHDRSIVTISVLLGKGILDSSFRSHLELGKKHGITRREIAALLTQAAFFAASRALFRAGSSMLASIAMIAITTSSSISVNFVAVGLKRRYAGGVSAAPRAPCVRQGAGAGDGTVNWRRRGWPAGKEDPQ